MPAFAKCMEATLAVWMGSYHGHSFSAEKYSLRVMDSLRPSQWEYYFNECLPSDGTILAKLAGDSTPVHRWRKAVEKYLSPDFVARDKAVKALLDATLALQPRGSLDTVHARAKRLRANLREPS